MVVESDAFASGSSHQWLEPCQMLFASVAAAMGICLGFPATARMAPLSLCRRRAPVEDDLAKPAPLSLDRDVVSGQLRLLQEQQILWSR